jgi:hypothetical protein
MNKFFDHLKTVTKHRREVRKLCFKCGLYWQGLTHDLSKYSPTEFWNGVKFYTGTKSHTAANEKNMGIVKRGFTIIITTSTMLNTGKILSAASLVA